MIEKPTRVLAGLWLGAVMLAAMAVHAQAQSEPAAAVPPILMPTLVPAAPQPDAAKLNDGLAVRYYFAKYNHIRELVDWMKYDDGVQGKPLAMIDHADTSGNVLTTTNSMLVGAHITGFIRFADLGTYRLRVTSNDGVRVTLSGRKVFEDPGVHKAETSPDLVYDVTEPGWYPLDILYYQKKGTSALQLHWQTPGAEGFVAVPGSAFKHP
jgi:hypothetical protein